MQEIAQIGDSFARQRPIIMLPSELFLGVTAADQRLKNKNSGFKIIFENQHLFLESGTNKSKSRTLETDRTAKYANL